MYPFVQLYNINLIFQKYKMSKKPFLIKMQNILEPTVPVDSQVYDVNQETRIQILQAINGYLTINMVVEALKIFWSFWHYQTECPAFSYLSLGFFGLNIIWAISSYCGFQLIKSKNTRNLKIFSYIILINLILRIAMYIVCGVVMKGKIPSYAQITTEELNNIICNALYPEALYIITGVVEAIICLIILFLSRSVSLYIGRWETSETLKHVPVRRVQNDDY